MSDDLNENIRRDLYPYEAGYKDAKKEYAAEIERLREAVALALKYHRDGAYRDMVLTLERALEVEDEDE